MKDTIATLRLEHFSMSSKPNSDIGLNPGDEDYLREQFPKMAEIFIWPELAAEFKNHEGKAQEKKSSSRRNSFYAIVFMVLSLSMTITSAAPIMTEWASRPDWLRPFLATVSLLFLVLSVFLGKGILFGRRRDTWLYHRLVGERLRHLYFQFLLEHMREACSQGSLSQQRVIDSRKPVLASAMKKFCAPVYVQIVKGDTNLEEAALLTRITGREEAELDPKKLDEFRKFWIEFRFGWQIGYATEQVGRRASPFPIFGSLADQEHTVSSLEFIATVGIIALQCLAVTTQLFGMGSTVENAVFLASSLAVAVVGLQAYRDGMGLTEDLTRNRVYASYSAKLLRDYKRAVQSESVSAEMQIMFEMEDLAYFETREFLHTHSNARFSL